MADLQIPVFLPTGNDNEINAEAITYVLIQVKCKTCGKLPTKRLFLNPVDLKLEEYQGENAPPFLVLCMEFGETASKKDDFNNVFWGQEDKKINKYMMKGKYDKDDEDSLLADLNYLNKTQLFVHIRGISCSNYPHLVQEEVNTIQQLAFAQKDFSYQLTKDSKVEKYNNMIRFSRDI